jgi:rhamnosyltransferase
MSEEADSERESRASVCAVVVTRNPEDDFLDSLRRIAEQVGGLIVVDNDSTGQQDLKATVERELPEAQFIGNQENVGIASALNLSIRHALDRGFEWILTLDQDATPGSDMVVEMLRVGQALSGECNVGVVAPFVVDRSLSAEARYIRKWRFGLFERARCRGRWIKNVTAIISAGAMYRAEVFRVAGWFWDGLFVDYVDTEHCLRLQRHGYQIVVACKATLHHRLGNRKEIRLGPVRIRSTFHPASRWYYIGRNRVHTIRRHGAAFPHWVLFDLTVGGYWIARMLAVEPDRWAKAAALWRGTLDGLGGKLGPRTLTDSR